MFQLRAPISARLSVTNKCNSKCIHCYQDAKEEYDEGFNTQEWKNIMDQLKKEGVFTLIFTGGEPLIRKDIEELIKYALDKGFIVSINTNGLLINEDNVKLLSKLWLIKISLDSFNKKKNDFFRGIKRCTERTIDKIHLLKKHKAKIAVQTTLSKFNIYEVKEILENTEKLGAIQYFSFFVPYGRGHIIKELLVEPNELKTFFNYLKKRKDNEPKVYVHHPLSFVLEKQKGKIEAACPLGNFGVSIESDGTVIPCPYWKYNLGNLKKESFHIIWGKWKNSSLCKNLLDNSKLKGKCKTCKNKQICNGGCRALAYYINNDPFSPDPTCYLNENV